jgi:hypothetical protein
MGHTRLVKVVLAAALVLPAAGCYHAIVDTGRPSSGQMIENNWAHSFLWGLVPPETVETATQCPNGVARVETIHSFLNQLASAVTWGIYSPMTIRVSCASGDDDDAEDVEALLVPATATDVQRNDAMNRAVDLSRERAVPVLVHFAN